MIMVTGELTMSSARFITLVTLFLVVGTTAGASTLFVAPDASGDHATIQAAIDAAANGDTILLGPGTFTGSGNVNVDSRAKSLLVTSLAGAALTVIDCAWTGRAFYIHDSTESFGIKDIHVTRGRAFGDRGGGVFVHNATVMVEECVFTLCVACDGGAIALIGSTGDVVRCRFDRNNCIWTDCTGIGGAGCTNTSRGGAVFSDASTVLVVGSHFDGNAAAWDFAYGLAAYAINSHVSMIGNRFYRNRYFDGQATVDLIDCQVEVVANEFVRNQMWRASGIRIDNCQGSVRGNLFEENLGHLGPGGISLSGSLVDVSFNYFKGNVGNSIETSLSTSSITRNLIIETTSSCCFFGAGIDLRGCDPQSISNNTFFQNGNPEFIDAGHEILFESDDLSIRRNILVSDSQEPFFNCSYYGNTCDDASLGQAAVVVEHNMLWGGFGDLINGNPCGILIDHNDPLLRDPANYNFFLKPESLCYVDTTIGTIVIESFQGALPKGNRPSGVVGITTPVSGHPTDPAPGDAYSLEGFAITNDSPVDAVVNYRLVISGAELWDAGDATSLIGSTPVLAPGETFVPPPAAVLVPAGNATVDIAYCFAYAPALNLVDTVTTTLHFEQPLAVRVTSFDATYETNGVRLRWVASTGGLEGWHLYRATSGNEWRRITTTALASGAREFFDGNAHAGERYRYRLVAIDGGEVLVGNVDIAPRVSLSLENSPNPFNPHTTIRFSIPSAAQVMLEIFGVDGAQVRTLVGGQLAGGSYSRDWDGRDDDGRMVASGIYFCRLVAGNQHRTLKMVLAR